MSNRELLDTKYLKDSLNRDAIFVLYSGEPNVLQYFGNVRHNSIKGRCPWCNGHRLRKWARRHVFKSWTILIASYVALIPLEKVRIQLFSLQLWLNRIVG